MIDLGDLALDVEAEVVDHRPMAAVLQVEVELVVLDHASGASVDLRPAAERLQRLDVSSTVVGGLELHGPSRNSDAATWAARCSQHQVDPFWGRRGRHERATGAARDAASEGTDRIGCVFTAQGFEFDDVGVIVGPTSFTTGSASNT